jgi:hypothetical protein
VGVGGAGSWQVCSSGWGGSAAALLRRAGEETMRLVTAVVYTVGRAACKVLAVTMGLERALKNQIMIPRQ